MHSCPFFKLLLIIRGMKILKFRDWPCLIQVSQDLVFCALIRFRYALTKIKKSISRE